MNGWLLLIVIYVGLLAVIGVGMVLIIGGDPGPVRRRFGWGLAMTGGVMLGIGTVLTLIAVIIAGAVDGMTCC